MTPKPCDRAFDEAEKRFRKSAENLLGAAIVCVRQAGHDLVRACRVFDNLVAAMECTDPEQLMVHETLGNIVLQTPRRSVTVKRLRSHGL